MMNVMGMREAADVLLAQEQYQHAYVIYDEIYNDIWYAVNYALSGITDFSREYLIHNISSSIALKNNFSAQVANTVFVKRYDLRYDEVCHELIYTIYGHLQCISYGEGIMRKHTYNEVLNEFLMLYSLILSPDREHWAGILLQIITPISDRTNVKKLHPKLREKDTVEKIVSAAPVIQKDEWKPLNLLLLDFLKSSGITDLHLRNQLQDIVGPFTTSGKHYRKREQRQKAYEKYEKYEKYERYERYEKYESREKSGGGFDHRRATELERAIYYGKILGLRGKITKDQIKERYRQLIAKYHPDRVSDLGDELRELAEVKAKEINSAYEYFKTKHKL